MLPSEKEFSEEPHLCSGLAFSSALVFSRVRRVAIMRPRLRVMARSRTRPAWRMSQAAWRRRRRGRLNGQRDALTLSRPRLALRGCYDAFAFAPSLSLIIRSPAFSLFLA